MYPLDDHVSNVLQTYETIDYTNQCGVGPKVEPV